MNAPCLPQLTHTKIVYKVGPTCVGKGYEENLEKRSLFGLTKAGLKIAFISFGQIIRNKLASDAEFQAVHGPTVGRGDLLDDPTAIALFVEALQGILSSGEPDIILVDGFCRSTAQIAFAIENGYLRKQDQFYFIEAALPDCMARFVHRKGKGDAKRIDHEMETFHRRYHLHRDTVGNLRNMLLEAENAPQIIDIDANRRPEDGDDFLKCIPDAVHPSILSTLLPLAFHQMAARQAFATV